MIIITDCLTKRLDEGCIKVANRLTEGLKAYHPETTVVSYCDWTEKSDIHLKLNRLFLNRKLCSLLQKNGEPVLYIPFSSNTPASIFRTFMLSLYSRQRVNVLYALQHTMNPICHWLLRYSRARVVALSEVSRDFYSRNGNDVIYVRAGVDTRKFCPVSREKKQELREKYHIPRDKTVVLHVGHLKRGRNVQAMTLLPEGCFGILVCSPRGAQDREVRRQLEERGNILILDSFLESVEELYQLSDVYLFPVLEPENCIDAPLSVLEAAACNIPVVTTVYGELTSLKREKGFFFLSDCEEKTMKKALAAAGGLDSCRNRAAVAGYDWELAVDQLIHGLGI